MDAQIRESQSLRTADTHHGQRCILQFKGGFATYLENGTLREPGCVLSHPPKPCVLYAEGGHVRQRAVTNRSIAASASATSSSAPRSGRSPPEHLLLGLSNRAPIEVDQQASPSAVADSVPFGVHANPVVARDVAEQFIASGRQVHGGPGGGSGKDAVTRVSTARTRGFAQTARLVDFAISADGSLAGILVGRKGITERTAATRSPRAGAARCRGG
jgi:hypothetical protein